MSPRRVLLPAGLAVAGALSCAHEANFNAPIGLGSSPDVLDVEDFGARPDDGRDDSPAIEAALRVAANRDGGIVLLRPGHWDITQVNGVRVPSSRNLRISGKGAQLLLRA